MRLTRQAYFAEKHNHHWKIYWAAEGGDELVCTYGGRGGDGSVSFAKDSMEGCTLAVENVMAIFDLIRTISIVEAGKEQSNEG